MDATKKRTMPFFFEKRKQLIRHMVNQCKKELKKSVVELQSVCKKEL